MVTWALREETERRGPCPGVHLCSARSSHPGHLFRIVTLVACIFLLSYNSYTTRCALLKDVMQSGFFVDSWNCASFTAAHVRMFLYSKTTPKRNPAPFIYHLQSSHTLSLRRLLISHLRICLFLTSSRNGIIQYSVFCVCLFHLP